MDWYLPIYEAIAHSAAASLVVLLVAMIVLTVVRQPVRRGRLILTTLLACLLVPALGFVPGLPHWSVEWTSEPEAVASPSNASLVPENTDLPPLEIETSDAFPLELATTEPGPEMDKSEAVAFVETVSVTTPFDYRLAMVVCYLTGAGAMSLWWMIGVIGLWRLQRRSISAPTEVRAVLRSIGGTDTDRVRLLMSRRVAQPFTFTWRRPVIVLPAELCETPDSDALRWCLAHEWAHVEDHHARAWLIASVVRVLFFYQPLVWWLRGQLRLSQDYLADNRAACQAAEPEDYAEFLTTIMASGLTRFAGSGLAMAARKSELYRRVVMITKTNAPLRRNCGRRWTWFTGAIGLAVVVAAAGYRLTPEVVEANEPVTKIPADEETVATIRVAEATIKELDETTAAGSKKTTDDTTKTVVKGELEGKVEIEFSEGQDVLVLRGKEADVNRVIRMLAEMEASIKGPIKKENLRYKGKSFQQWRRDLLTELDVDSRKEAIKAIGVFGRKGLGAEVTETLVGLFSDSDVRDAAARTLRDVGAVAIPSLTKALESEETSIRQTACYALQMGPAGKDAIPHLVRLLQDDKSEIQEAACKTIGNIGGFDRSIEAKLVDLFEAELTPGTNVASSAIFALAGISEPDAATVSALIKATNIRPTTAGVILAQIGPPTKEVIAAVARSCIAQPTVLYGMSGRLSYSRVRYKPKPEIMEPASIRVIELANDSVKRHRLNDVRYTNEAGKRAVQWLKDHGPIPASAVAAMTDLLFRTKVTDLQENILTSLHELGPEAKEAIPTLEAGLAEYNRITNLKDSKPKDSRERQKLLFQLSRIPSGRDLAKVLKSIEGDTK